MTDKSEAFLDLPFIRKALADPLRTSRKLEDFVSNLPDRSDSTNLSKSLDRLGNNNLEISKGIADIIRNDQSGYQNMASSIDDVSYSIDDMSLGFESGLGELSSSIQSIYGSKLPEGKSLIEIGKDLTFNGKRTLIALAANGGISSERLNDLFHPDFVKYLNAGYSSGEVSNIQYNLHSNINALQNYKANLKSQKAKLLQDSNREKGKSEKKEEYDQRMEQINGTLIGLDGKLSSIDSQEGQIRQHLMYDEEIKLLDVGVIARAKSLKELIQLKIIEPGALGTLIRNNFVDAELSSQFARFTKRDKFGGEQPFLRLDGISGIHQQTESIRRMSKRSMEQRHHIIENLEGIGETVKDGFEQFNQNLGNIDDSINQGFDKTNENLENIDNTINRTGEITYGIQLPEKKKLSDLVKELGFRGKQTLLALYAQGLIKDKEANILYSAFTPAFIKNLTVDKKTSDEVRQEQRKRLKEYNQNKEELNKLMKTSKSGSKITDLRDSVSALEESLINEDEIELFDMYKQAKRADSIEDLIEMNVLDDDVLTHLIRHQKLDGETSLKLARIMKLDEDGINPKLELDGDVGRWQQLKTQTIQGNLALRQRGEIISGLGDISEHIQQGNAKLGDISEYAQQSTQALGYLNDQIAETNEYLYDILDTNVQTNELLEGTNYLIQESNDIHRVTNQILDNMSKNIRNQLELTRTQIVEALEGIGNVLIAGFNETLNELKNLNEIQGLMLKNNQEMLGELQKQTSILESIHENLNKPLDIQSDAYFKAGLELAGEKEWEFALKSFDKGLEIKQNHLLNLYGAGSMQKILGKDKEAIKKLRAAYRLAVKIGNNKFASRIVFDIAKLHIKNLNLKKGKIFLDEAISNDTGFIEAYLLKARITKILKQKEELKLILNIIYQKIIQEDRDFSLTENYNDVLKYIYKPVTDQVNQQIQHGMSSKLLKVLPRLEKIGNKQAIKNVLGHMLFQNPQLMLHSGIDIKSVLESNKVFFSSKYQEYLNQRVYGGISEDIFALAFCGYKVMATNIIHQLISLGLDYDPDYISLKNSKDTKQKKEYKDKVIDKIYSLGSNAKYMLRDYLQSNNDCVLNG